MPKGDRLSDKQQKFVYEYVKCLNATKAAERAGYKATNGSLGVIGHNNLKNVKIKGQIDQFLEKNAMSAIEVVSRIADQARSDLGDFADIKRSEDIKNHPLSRVIKKFKRHITTDKLGNTYEDIEIELYDAQKALQDIGRIHNLFTDKIEHTGTIENRMVILPAKDE